MEDILLNEHILFGKDRFTRKELIYPYSENYLFDIISKKINKKNSIFKLKNIMIERTEGLSNSNFSIRIDIKKLNTGIVYKLKYYIQILSTKYKYKYIFKRLMYISIFDTKNSNKYIRKMDRLFKNENRYITKEKLFKNLANFTLRKVMEIEISEIINAIDCI